MERRKVANHETHKQIQLSGHRQSQRDTRPVENEIVLREQVRCRTRIVALTLPVLQGHAALADRCCRTNVTFTFDLSDGQELVPVGEKTVLSYSTVIPGGPQLKLPYGLK